MIRICFRCNLVFKEEKTSKLHDDVTGHKSSDQIFISNCASSIHIKDQKKE